jgi:hypothetical protein
MNSDLMRAFQFTVEDLAHNKQGRLSPQQVTRLQRNNRAGAVIMFILLIPSAVFTFIVLRPIIFKEQGMFDDLWRLSGGVALALITLLFFLNFFKFLLRKKDPVVTKVQGKVRSVISREERDHEGDKVTMYYVVIDEQEIRIRRLQTGVFHEGHTYAIYRDAVLGNLSVEHIGGPPEA